MSKLSPKDRDALPKKDFALPEQKRFPVEDEAHARNAKSRATQSMKAGHLSKTDKARVDAKADEVLGKD